MRRAIVVAIAGGAVALASAAPARADGTAAGVAELGSDLAPQQQASPSGTTEVEVSGLLRFRGETLYNLDLDRGLTPSGEPLFPVPLADPKGQTFNTADTRLRTDLTLARPGSGVAVHVRVDVLDNLVLGSTPEGKPSSSRAPTPAGSPGQQPPVDAFRIKRAYGEVLLPFGVLAAGRMGAHWGLGMIAHGGDCDDCDGGDAADRVALVTPLVGHLWAASYDFAATGPTARRRDDARAIDIEPTDDVRTVTFAVLKWHSDATLARRRRAGRTSIEYGAYVSHRWQDNDIPADYLPTAQPAGVGPAQVMARGFRATAADAWARVTLPQLRVELEAAWMTASVDQPSLVPGVLFDEGVTSNALGVAAETEYRSADARFGAGVDVGYASGDPAPGFGAFPAANAPAPAPGDLDGPQASLPGDTQIDNFRFHPDYRVDRILFREIIGTVTDAFYLRPHARYRLINRRDATLTVDVALVGSWAVEAASTPGGNRALGIELDPTLRLDTRDGFSIALEHALLLPGAGLDNPVEGLSAKPAQLLRLRLGYAF